MNEQIVTEVNCRIDFRGLQVLRLDIRLHYEPVQVYLKVLTTQWLISEYHCVPGTLTVKLPLFTPVLALTTLAVLSQNEFIIRWAHIFTKKRSQYPQYWLLELWNICMYKPIKPKDFYPPPVGEPFGNFSRARTLPGITFSCGRKNYWSIFFNFFQHDIPGNMGMCKWFFSRFLQNGGQLQKKFGC